ncbi:MAG: hypothetical protein LBS54_02155 [Dysgonamonadaceae bacterium]|jgi:hypothetical protein|nr:hypothetical protein [Dysgonamonadaceae bacterium]
MARRNFIPRSQSLFFEWQEVFMVNLGEIGAETLMPVAVYNNLTSLQSGYKQSYIISENPITRTSGAIVARNNAREIYEKELRRVIKVYIINNPDVTDKQRMDMKLPIHKTTRTPSQVSKKSPYLKVVTRLIRSLIIEFGESETSKAKPSGQQRIEFIYVISEERPTSIAQLNNSKSFTRTPINISFKESERGKTVWFAARWENTRAKKGPWTAIMYAIIP